MDASNSKPSVSLLTRLAAQLVVVLHQPLLLLKLEPTLPTMQLANDRLTSLEAIYQMTTSPLWSSHSLFPSSSNGPKKINKRSFKRQKTALCSVLIKLMITEETGSK